MIAEVIRKDLIHTHPGMSLTKFLEQVDATGGWPVGFKYVRFYHASENTGRYCVFTNSGANTEWWTVVCTADDYYWWKLSEEKRAEIVKAARNHLILQLQRM